MAVLLEIVLWGALLSRNDTDHQWAVQQFRRFQSPLLGCEAVVAETCILLKRPGFDPSLVLPFIERGVVHVPFVLQERIGPVSQLSNGYKSVPASLADVSLIRLQ